MVTRLPFVIAAHAVVFWMVGLYRGMWRYASLPDIQRILVAAGIAWLAVAALLTLLRLGDAVHHKRFVDDAVQQDHGLRARPRNVGGFTGPAEKSQASECHAP